MPVGGDLDAIPATRERGAISPHMESPATYQLLCEGFCNPGAVLFELNDLTVASWRLKRQQNDMARCDLPGMADVVRRLRYTAHRMHGLDKAVCVVCRHERRYG